MGLILSGGVARVRGSPLARGLRGDVEGVVEGLLRGMWRGCIEGVEGVRTTSRSVEARGVSRGAEGCRGVEDIEWSRGTSSPLMYRMMEQTSRVEVVEGSRKKESSRA